MGKNRHTAEQIIAKLREAEVELAQGRPLAEVVRELEIAEQTNYRWRYVPHISWTPCPDFRSLPPQRVSGVVSSNATFWETVASGASTPPVPTWLRSCVWAATPLSQVQVRDQSPSRLLKNSSSKGTFEGSPKGEM